MSEMSTTGKFINKKSDEIDGNFLNAKKSFTIGASKLWIYGISAPHHGKLHIKFNKINHVVDTDSITQEFKLLFESEKIDFTTDSLDLVAIENKPVLIHCVYYLYDPPVQMESRRSLDFVNKNFTKKLPENKQIYIESNSEIAQITGCTFADIESSSTYFIRLAKEVLFYQNNFEFSTFGDYSAPIYLDDEFQGSLTISHCTFVKCVARENNGNVLYCDSDANFTFECCIFINCGNNRSQTMIKSQSSIGCNANFTNCSFLFDLDCFSCCVYEADFSGNALFDHCEFSKCSVANIAHRIDSFEFTSNIVTSSLQQIIFINNLKRKLTISFNIFKNSILNDTNFITLIHNINEIELFNNTFSNFSAVNHENHSFLYLQRYTHIKSYVIFNECRFLNIQNDCSAFQIGCSFATANAAIDFVNCEFINNTCTKGKGGALSVSIEHELLISKCTFKNNKAKCHGGALVLHNIKNVEIISCTFDGNRANDISSSDGIKGRGGAIYISMHNTVSDSIIIESCKFMNNSAFDGYAIYIAGDENGEKIVISFNLFIENYDKSSNSSEKGVITSAMHGLYEEKILISNEFISEGSNISHPLKYTEQNYLIYKFKIENFPYFHCVLILSIIIMIIIILTVIFVRNSIDNTFVFVILDDNTLKARESSNESTVLKCTNYFLTPYALLIKRLAIRHLGINEQHICILRKEDESDFDISTLLPDNKILIQLTFDEIYTTKYFKSELNIQNFQNTSTLIVAIKSFLQPFKCKRPNVILFLYDNGDENKFEVYLKLSSIPHSSLQIYNESCKGNSMLTITNYFTVSEVINSFWTKITPNDLYFLHSVAKQIYLNRNSNQWDLIGSLDRKYRYYFSKVDKCQSFEIIATSEDYLLYRRKILNEDFFSYFSIDEIDCLTKIINCYKSEYSKYPHNYEEIHYIFEKGIKVVKKILSKLDCSNAEFIQILDSFRDNVFDSHDINFKMHNNHSLITCSHQIESSPTFGSIKVNENLKIVAGSPAMGAFVIEALMKRSYCINDIKKLIYKNYNGLIMKYGTQCNKKWISLSINCWESDSFSKKKMLLNQNINNAEIDIEDIMRSVGFHLCDSSCKEFKKETQPPIRRENHKKINVIGVRLSDQNQEYDYNIDHIYNDYYYSEDCSNTQTNISSSITKSSSFEEFFDSVDFDMAIPSEYVFKICQDVKVLNSVIFPLRFYEVFKYELKKLCESPKFNNKHPRKSNEAMIVAPERFKCKLRNWIMYFFPSYTIISEIDDLMNLFYTFTFNHEISEEDYKIIFYKCMNVADQVASQLSRVNKKTAYYADRLKKQ